MKNIDHLTNEDLDRLADYIVKPGGPADLAATQRAIDLFCSEGIKSLIAVGLSGDVEAFLYIHQKIIARMAANMGEGGYTFVPASPESH